MWFWGVDLRGLWTEIIPQIQALSAGVGTELETNNIRLCSNVKAGRGGRQEARERYRYYILYLIESKVVRAVVQIFRKNRKFYDKEKTNCPTYFRRYKRIATEYTSYFQQVRNTPFEFLIILFLFSILIVILVILI